MNDPQHAFRLSVVAAALAVGCYGAANNDPIGEDPAGAAPSQEGGGGGEKRDPSDSGGAAGKPGLAGSAGGTAGSTASSGADWSARNDRDAAMTAGGSTAPSDGGGASTGGSPVAGEIVPQKGVKLAFIGDTGDDERYRGVVALVKSQGAALVVAGDMTYSSNPGQWWRATEGVLGPTYPVFLARGNHDDNSWDGFLPKAQEHLDGATRVPGPHSAAHKTVYKGVSLVTVRRGDNADTIRNLFKDDKHLWKVCYWHQNQKTMQVGHKGDEMGWAVYEACRELGALIITAHEHSYSRTKTLTSASAQQVDPTCNGIDKLCLGPGRTFVTVTGLGGKTPRAQERCLPAAGQPPYPSLNTSDPTCRIWGSIYTANQKATHGALILEFNREGDPRKARGTFTTSQGQVIDDYVVTHD